MTVTTEPVNDTLATEPPDKPEGSNGSEMGSDEIETLVPTSPQPGRVVQGSEVPTGQSLPPAEKATEQVAAKKTAAKKTAAKKTAAKKTAAKKTAAKAKAVSKRVPAGEPRRARRTPLFPASTFEDALEIAAAIYSVGAGQPVRRITLFDHLGKSPDSGTSRQLITNSAKYGLTSGSYQAEFLSLTENGKNAVADDVSVGTQLRARFKLAIQDVDVFELLYSTYLGNRLPAQAVLIDKAKEAGVPDEDLTECVETFTVNTKFVGVLRSISGAERLLTIDAVLDDYLPASKQSAARTPTLPSLAATSMGSSRAESGTAFENACFYITPIGSEGSEQRKHSDLFMGALIEPALAEFNLNLVRADQIGDAGMITGQIIEHIIHSKLVIVDLSFHQGLGKVGHRRSSRQLIARVGCLAWCRRAAAMLVAPARRSRLIAVLRSVAMICGALAVRTWDRSSSKVTSRTQWILFSMLQWPCTQEASTAGAALR